MHQKPWLRSKLYALNSTPAYKCWGSTLFDGIDTDPSLPVHRACLFVCMYTAKTVFPQVFNRNLLSRIAPKTSSLDCLSRQNKNLQTSEICYVMSSFRAT